MTASGISAGTATAERTGKREGGIAVARPRSGWAVMPVSTTATGLAAPVVRAQASGGMRMLWGRHTLCPTGREHLVRHSLPTVLAAAGVDVCGMSSNKPDSAIQKSGAWGTLSFIREWPKQIGLRKWCETSSHQTMTIRNFFQTGIANRGYPGRGR